MLVKATNVIGLKILTLQDGKLLDRINDIIYDPHDNAIKAFVVDKGGLFSQPKVVLTKDISSIGKNAVMVKDESVLKNASDAGQNIADIAKEDTYLTKSKIVTEDGTTLGSVSDIYFDDKTGHVEELEVSQGGLQNFQSGKKHIKIADVMTIGKDATIVKTEATQEIAEQSKQQGMQGALNKAKGNVGAVVQQTQESLQNTGKSMQDLSQNKDVRQKSQEAANSFKEQSQKAVNNLKQATMQGTKTVKEKVKETTEGMHKKRLQDAVGKYVTVNIISQHDQIIAKRGDMITHELLATAEKENALDNVLNNASKDPIEDRAYFEEKAETRERYGN